MYKTPGENRCLINEYCLYQVLGCFKIAQDGALWGVHNHTWPFPCNAKKVEIGGREKIARIFAVGKK
jgi:hypothetical protein